MKKSIIVLLVIISSCSFFNKKNKWLKEPNHIKYSKEREKEVWGRVLLGKDVALYYGTPVQTIAEAIANGDNSELAEELKKLPKDYINYREEKFRIPLNKFAILHANFEALKLLTEHGADPNLPSSNGETAFTESVLAARLLLDNKYMTYLIENGGDVNYDQSTYTPLMIASRFKLENVILLVEAGADPHYVDKRKNNSIVHSPLKTAILNDRIDIVNYYLFECGVDPHGITITNPKTGQWTIIDDVNDMVFKKTDKASYRKKEELMEYLQEIGFKLRGE